MIKVTIWFDYPSKENFFKSFIWTIIATKLTILEKCIAFHLDEVEDVTL